MKIIFAAGLLTLAAGAALAQDKPAETAASDVSRVEGNTVAVTGSSASSASAGVCTAPAAPPVWSPAPLPHKAAVPSCLNLTTHTTTCSKAVLDHYNAAVQARNDALREAINQTNAYLATLNRFTRDANDYNNCEVDRLNKLLDAGN
jgi:hypothetical protein